MERLVFNSIHQVLDKFHISYDFYENYMDKWYTFDLKSKDLFVDIFIDVQENTQGPSRDEKLTTGSFYTPKDLANVIVDRTLSYYNGDLKQAKVADLSAGTGNLLIEYVQYLNLQSDDERLKILSQIYAYDIQWESLVIYVNRILMMFDKFPDSLSLNVFPEDSLTAEIPYCFDIILGNPPYIGEKGNKELFRKIKETEFGKKYYESKMDYYYYFMFKSYELLKAEGVMGTVTTNYHFTADGANLLRQYIKKYISYKEIINYSDEKLFKDALGQHNVITIATLKRAKGSVKIINQGREYYIEEDQLFAENGYIQVYHEIEDYYLLDKIKQQATFLLGDFFEIHQGIVSGADALSASKIKSYDFDQSVQGEGIFVLSSEEIQRKGLEDSIYLKRFYKNSDIGHYRIDVKSEKYILYIDDDHELKETDREYQHLLKYKPILEKRREVINGKRHWYALQWPRLKSIFEMDKIIVPHRNRCNRFALSQDDFYASADVYYIVPRSSVFDMNVIAGILNSKLMYYWLYNMGKKKGHILELYSTPLKHIPIYYNHIDEIEELVKEYMSTNDEACINAIDQEIYKMYQLNDDEILKVETFYNCMGTE